MIYFYDIFEKAITLFSDPDLDRFYYEDQAGFQSDMRDYLMVGKNKFTYPTAITDKLIVCDEAVGYSESDSGDGTDTYTLQETVANHGDKVGFTYAIDGKPVGGQYDPENNTITFDRPVLATETWAVSWFYAGAFSADFSGCLRSDFPMAMMFMEKGIPEKFINLYGAERMAFGTDYPLWDPVVETKRFLELDLTDEQFEQIGHKTAERFLHLK